MFISLSKLLSKFGHIHFGIRVNKNNALWILFIWMFVAVFQMTWYMILVCFWLVYAVFYGVIALLGWLWRLITGKNKKVGNA